MSKLKNYEIEALVETITSEVIKKKTAKLEQEIEHFEEDFKVILVEYRDKVEQVKSLLKECNMMEKQIKDTVKDYYNFGFTGTVNAHYLDKVEGIKFDATPYSKYTLREEIKNHVIITNINGNVREMIDEIVEKFV